MNLKKLMKTMVKMALENGGTYNGNGSQQMFDMARDAHNQAHTMAHNQAMRDLNMHMNTANNFAMNQMMHGPHF